MIDKIEKHLKNTQELTEEFKEWVKDKSIDLDIRWNTFIKSELGTKSSSYEEFEGVDSDDIGEDGPIYVSKYEYISVEEVLKMAKFKTESETIAFKEDVLDSFICGFTFDW